MDAIVGGRLRRHLLLLRGDVPLPPPPLGSRNYGSRPLTSISSRRHRSRKQSDGKGNVPVRFIVMLKQSRQYDVSCQQDIGYNLSSTGSTLTNHRGNALFWLRKRIWETCDGALYTSGGD